VKPGDGVISKIGVVIERGYDPGVRQLQQRSPTGPEKQGRLAMDLPTDGGRAEDAGLRIGGLISNGIPKTLDLPWRDGLAFSFHPLLDSMVVLGGKSCSDFALGEYRQLMGVPPLARA
jgi:hypothetical protein